MTPRLRLVGIAFLSLLIALAVAWLATVGALREPNSVTSSLIGSLVLSGSLALIIGFLVTVVGMPLLPRLSFQIAAGYFIVALAGIITLLYTPMTMFVQPRDLQILIVLMTFFLVIAVGLATIVGLTIGRPLRALATAARSVGAGAYNTHVRVPPSSNEISQVTTAFNRMADELDQASQREQAMEEGRRRLIAAISHDLRTPLTGVRLTLEGVRDGVVRDDATITSAIRDIDQLGRLIDDLFELSQLESRSLRLAREVVNVGDVITASLDGLRLLADEKRVALAPPSIQGRPEIVGDSVQLRRVISNLVQNSIQHTAAGGEVRVHAQSLELSVVIKVSDTGEGVRPDDLPYIFDYFYRADAARERRSDGAGLGLSIAKAIVEAHGGTIAVQSKPGHGATVTVVLPAAP